MLYTPDCFNTQHTKPEQSKLVLGELLDRVRSKVRDNPGKLVTAPENNGDFVKVSILSEGLDEKFDVEFNNHDWEQVEKAANKLGLSTDELIKRAVKDFLERYTNV